MIILPRPLKAAAAALLGLLISACAAAPAPTAPPPETPTAPPIPTPTPEPATPTVLDVLADPRFSTLRTAVEAAGISSQLSAAPVLTLFAPTDEAFAALPEGALDELLADPQGRLTALLFYHAVSMRLTAQEVTLTPQITTLLAEPLAVVPAEGGGVTVGGASITEADIAITNGYVHVVDQVLVPPGFTFEATLAQIILDQPNLTTLNELIETAGLAETFNGDDAFTILAPSNAAFEALPDDVLGNLQNDPGALQNVLGFHVIPGRFTAAELTAEGLNVTLFGQNVLVYAQGGVPVVAPTAEFVEADLEAANGLLHIINSVLLPVEVPAAPESPDTIAQVVGQRPELTTLLAAVLAAGLSEEFQAPGQLTLFAPTNEAFDALPEGTLDALLADPARLRRVLLYHTLYGQSAVDDVIAAPVLATAAGESISVTVEGASVTLEEQAAVGETNIFASNGVIHLIDSVLIPPEGSATASIAEQIAADPQYSTLAAAIEAAELSETLAGPGAFTLFAPTNVAFEALPEGALDALLANPEELRRVLLYHAVNGARTQAAAADEKLLVSLEGGPLLVLPGDASIFVNGAPIIQPDVTASNGVIHGISSIILPPPAYQTEAPLNAAALIADDLNLSTFNAALEASGLATTLAGAGPFTVFAPTNAAFEALPEGRLEFLLTDPQGDLRAILLNHITIGAYESPQVLGFTDLLMAYGERLPIDAQAAQIGGVSITGTDVTASNGVIHVIDGVMLPVALQAAEE